MTIELLEYLYSKGFDVNARNEREQTPLLAMGTISTPCQAMKAKWLRSKGATIHDVWKNGENMLHLLARSKPSVAIPLMRNEFKDVEWLEHSDSGSPLACWYHGTYSHEPNVEMLKELLARAPKSLNIKTMEDGEGSLLLNLVNSSTHYNPAIAYLVEQLGLKFFDHEDINSLEELRSVELMKELIARGVMKKAVPDLQLVFGTIDSREGQVAWESFRYLIDEGVNMASMQEELMTLSVESGNLGLVSFLVEEKKFNPKQVDADDQRTLLFQAISRGGMYPLVVRYLVQKCGLDINQPDSEGVRPINSRRFGGGLDLDDIKFLVELGADLSARNGADNLLHVSTIHPKVVKYLVEEQGFDVNEEGEQGLNALSKSFLFRNRSEESALYLLSKGAKFRDEDGPNNSLINATSLGFIQVVKVLINQGARISARNKRGGTVLHVAVRASAHKMELVKLFVEEHGVDVNGPTDKFGNSVLLSAAQEEGGDVIKYLISRGADVRHSNSAGKTPLFEALSLDLDVVKAVVEAAGRVEFDWDKISYTSFATSTIVEIFDYLLQKADVDQRHNFIKFLPALISSSEATLAGERRLLKVFELFVKFHIDLTAPTNTKTQANILTLISNTLVGKSKILLEFLINHGVDLEQKDTEGRTVMYRETLWPSWNALDSAKNLYEHGAQLIDLSPYCIIANPTLAEWLINHGATFIRSEDGDTALHKAVTIQNPRIIKGLLKHQKNETDKGVRNFSEKLTPYMSALQCCSLSTLHLLRTTD